MITVHNNIFVAVSPCHRPPRLYGLDSEMLGLLSELQVQVQSH